MSIFVDNRSMNNETSSSSPLDGVTIFVTLLQIVICLLGIILYTIAIQIMIAYRKTTFANPFYTLAIALAAPDCLHLVMELVCAVPVVFIGFDNVPLSFVAVCGFLTTFAYWWLAPIMVVIAVNRYVAVCHFESYKSLFAPDRVRILIASCFASAFVLPILMYSCNCLYLFKDDAWKYYCHGGCSEIALNTNAVLSSAYTIAVALVYGLNFLRYKLIQRQLKKSFATASAQQQSSSNPAVGSASEANEEGMLAHATILAHLARTPIVYRHILVRHVGMERSVREYVLEHIYQLE